MMLPSEISICDHLLGTTHRYQMCRSTIRKNLPEIVGHRLLDAFTTQFEAQAVIRGDLARFITCFLLILRPRWRLPL